MNITATLIAQMVAFVILIWMVNHFMWGPITSALEKRRKDIEDGLAAAEQGRQDLETANVRTQEIENEARSKAAEIISHAEKRASEVIGAAKTTAQEEAGRIKQAAQAETERQISQAKESLRKQVAEVAMLGASKVIGREVDAKAHADVLDELSKQI